MSCFNGLSCNNPTIIAAEDEEFLKERLGNDADNDNPWEQTSGAQNPVTPTVNLEMTKGIEEQSLLFDSFVKRYTESL